MIPLIWIKSTERENFKGKLSKSENENRENSLLINQWFVTIGIKLA